MGAVREDVTWPDTTVLAQDVPEQVAELKQQPGKDIMVPGSPTLVRWLLRNDLLDELHFSVFLIVVGSGSGCSRTWTCQ